MFSVRAGTAPVRRLSDVLACGSTFCRRAYSTPTSDTQQKGKGEDKPEKGKHQFIKPQLNFKQFAADADTIRKSIQQRKSDGDIDKVLEIYQQFRNLQDMQRELRTERNSVVEGIKKEKRKTDSQSQQAVAKLQAQGAQVRNRLAAVEADLTRVEETLIAEGSKIPNYIHPESPVGPEDQARVVALQGEKRDFDFTLKNHLDIGTALDLFDFEAGSQASGHRFYYLKNAAALLEVALVQYAMTTCVARGFTPIISPDVVRVGVAEGCGFRPRDAATQIYSLGSPHDDLCLVGTAEIALAGMLMNKTFNPKDLPLRLVGFGRSFRAEAGAYGALQRGLYRVHQFSKVEMYGVTTADPDNAASNQMLEDLLALQRDLFTPLEIHYKVLDMPTEDLGAPAYRKYDIEAWMPGRGQYGEISSASNCTDYQSRRLNIRHTTSDRKTVFAHTLNATACAIPRIIIAILETHQQQDGTVRIPKALQPFLGGMDAIRPPARI
eukprot:comp6490_c0_seq1/m.2266 comp6490_c0_seq1/g.2266  ORF comp6490_c0_seq1/g.2266 comp6490_c0_seq1/m.2266 type:complete len:494 (-) comp6490_c0_seq1:625-2106(-)